uniref:SHSP domain-containing protein n=1 Tax=Cannabis sativa TaxID=3483 RepID=A0A803Q1N9_CANSA
MVHPFQSFNSIKILIPSGNWTSLLKRVSLVLLLIFVNSLYIIAENPIGVTTTNTMKVHPMPKKRNITIHYEINNRRDTASESRAGLTHKKLRRLPHVFSRVLELPFRSDADVSVEESADFFRFVAETEGFGVDVRAHTVEIHPGVTKIVVRGSGSTELSLDELELDMWRFRLPETTRPELARAVFVDGELIVTVPKGEGVENSEHGGDGGGEVWGDGTGNGNNFRGGMGSRLVLVQ